MYYEGNKLKSAISYCSKCQLPLNNHITRIEGIDLCPFCEDQLIRGYLETAGFAWKLLVDFRVDAEKMNASHYA